MDTKPGMYLRRTGRQLTQEAPGRPEAVICRRVADYPFGRPPSVAVIAACADCGAPIAYNPTGPHQDQPRICMQCYGLMPLPFGD